MNKFLRTGAVVCASLILSLSAARADDSSSLVRMTQIHLNYLGYYVGQADGKMGPKTETALMEFQRTAGLPVTGDLTPETFSRLSDNHVAAFPSHYITYAYDGRGYDLNADTHQVLISASPRMLNSDWNYIHTFSLPSRFVKLDVSENDHQSRRDYVVTLNGLGVLFANDQPYVLRASQTFAVNSDEDAVILTAQQGDGACASKNYLLTIHRNGTFELPREIGNCSGRYEAHVTGNALLISFPVAGVVNGWQSWAMWRYENGSLIRV